MGEFVLMKRGLYWRPDACGYTGVLAEAGRYTKEQVEARVDASSKPSVTAHRVEDCAEFSPACWPETQIAVLRAENTRMREAAEDVYTTWAGGEPLDREMRELGRALGFQTDPA